MASRGLKEFTRDEVAKVDLLLPSELVINDVILTA